MRRWLAEPSESLADFKVALSLARSKVPTAAFSEERAPSGFFADSGVAACVVTDGVNVSGKQQRTSMSGRARQAELKFTLSSS